MPFCRAVRKLCFLLLLFSLVAHFTWAQSETATVSGQVVDPSGLNITGAQVKLVDIDRDTSTSVTTNTSGLYTFTSVKPGRYRMEVTVAGFKVVNVTGITVNVQDHLEQNFKLVVGSVSESITVEGGAPLVETESAAVSTVVDRNFAENLPLNGRSFQTLIQLTPGVVLTANNGVDSGQFSVNGQRASSNYWMVDGVSANIGISVGQTTGNGLGGAIGSFSVFGGTNSLVSVDALQEFRIQTSTFSPEFGRTPGAQISIVTRSGTNDFHGTAFDYLRNDLFDANDWFANNAGLPKPKERQNDFGGTFSGPIVRAKTFFFFSYEGLRLRLPQTELTSVPDLASRRNALPSLQPFLNAYPVPNGPDNAATGVAQFDASFSNPGALDAYSLRIDHKLNEKLNLFGRYDYSPSQFAQRGAAATLSLSTVFPDKVTTETGTMGLTWGASPAVSNDLRFNYGRTNSSSRIYLDTFGGAVPLALLPIPNPFTTQNARFGFEIVSLGTTSGALLLDGKNASNQQRQINIVDGLSVQKGTHGLKFGIDFRRLSPEFSIPAYAQTPVFLGVSQAETGNALATELTTNRSATLLLRNLGLFAQDAWRIAPRLTLTYGLRWDIDFTPSSIDGPGLAAVAGFNINDLSELALAPAGTPPFNTRYGNVAPRLGVAYQLSQNQNLQSVLRGGIGLFYDLATAEAGNVLNESLYPFGGFGQAIGTFPLTNSEAAPPPITPPDATNGQILYAFDPNLRLPYTLQWNFAVQQALGTAQTVTASYIGSVGRRLIQTAAISAPNSDIGSAQLVTNAAKSNYDALQLQFQRRLSHGFQVLASYTWAHSIDTASASSIENGSNALTALNPNLNRGPSDFDIRNALSVAFTYEVQALKKSGFSNAILRGWSTENVFQARSAPPVDVYYSEFGQLSNGFATNVRPDLVAGQSFYLYGSNYPGGKAFNSSAFASPPIDPTTGLPSGQGNLPRNALRGFGAAQWDFAVHRDFPIHESLILQFRAEMFNVVNHPNFGQPVGDLGFPGALNTQFGQSIQMLGRSLSGTVGSGGFAPLYQIGGPRSIQFALKFRF